MKKILRIWVVILSCFIIASGEIRARADTYSAGTPPVQKLAALDHYNGREEFSSLAQPANEAEASLSDPQPAASNALIANTRYVFQSLRDNNWEIYTSDGDYTVQNRVTSDTDADIHPRLNRGATQIVFASKRTGSYDIYSMNFDGAGLKRLTVNTVDDVNPDWSPDGAHIVFQSYRDGQPEIYVMNADGSNQIRLTNDPGYDGEPRWSPDGTQIAFASYRMAEGGIWIMNADGSNLHLMILKRYASDPVWSPDGTQIAFSADRNGSGFVGLCTAGVSGSNFSFLVYNGHPFYQSTNSEAWAAAWSPDGRYILITEIGFVQYNGNWYWTQAFGSTYDTSNKAAALQFADAAVWNPDIQTTDVLPPVVSLNQLSPASPTAFQVSWSGVDQGPAGMLNFDVQVKDLADGAWSDWRFAIGYESATFQGQGGHTYAFRVRGRDQHGSVSDWVENPLAITGVESTAPYVSITAPAYLSNGALITWQGEDWGGSGILGYDVQYRESASLVWTPWQTGVQQTGARFNAILGKEYYFRARATDKANNSSSWVESKIPTRICGLALQGVARNNLGLPVSSAVIRLAGQADATALSALDGSFNLCSSSSQSSYTVNWSAYGYASLPASTFGISETVQPRLVFPPADNIVVNGDFEAGSLAGWQSAGSLPAGITANQFTSGGYAALLGRVSSGLSAVERINSNPNAIIGGVALTRTPDGQVHMAYGEYNHDIMSLGLYLQSRPLGGTWLPRVQFDQANMPYSHIALFVDDQGTLQVGYTLGGYSCCYVYITPRTLQGVWGTPFLVGGGPYAFQMMVAPNADFYFMNYLSLTDGSGQYLIHHQANRPFWQARTRIGQYDALSIQSDRQGTVNLLFVDTDYTNSLLKFSRRDANGIWQETQILDVEVANYTSGYFSNPQLQAEPNGVLHALWSNSSDVKYSRRDLAGNWSPFEYLPLQEIKGDMLLSPTGVVSFIATNRSNYGQIVYNEKQPGGNWLPPVAIAQLASFYVEKAWVQSGNLGQVHVLLHLTSNYNNNTTLIYIWRNAAGIWQPPMVLDQATYPKWVGRPAMTEDDHGQAYIAWVHGNTYTGLQNLYYQGPDIAPQNGLSLLQKNITVPDEPAPVLSFIYKLESAADGPVPFSVSLEGALKQTTVFSATQPGGWTHAWANLSDYAGQSITVTFALSQTAGQPAAWGFVDDVSVGTGLADVWISSAPTAALPGSQVTYALSYGNQGSQTASNVLITHTLPSELTFISASIPVTPTGSTLVWNLGSLSGGSTGTILITVSLPVRLKLGTYLVGSADINTSSFDPETGNSGAQSRIYIGHRVFLPMLR